jgi:hypothetical protein
LSESLRIEFCYNQITLLASFGGEIVKGPDGMNWYKSEYAEKHVSVSFDVALLIFTLPTIKPSLLYSARNIIEYYF